MPMLDPKLALPDTMGAEVDVGIWLVTDIEAEKTAELPRLFDFTV
jgi:hypothetical protein